MIAKYVWVIDTIYRAGKISFKELNRRWVRDEEISDYAKQLLEGIESHQDEINELIESNLKGWKINRISKVALAAMRISVYEMKYIKSVPVSVSINEAVRVTKTFAFDEDGSFVNGVLGAVAKTLKGDK